MLKIEFTSPNHTERFKILWDKIYDLAEYEYCCNITDELMLQYLENLIDDKKGNL
jgi:hypothetical protein